MATQKCELIKLFLMLIIIHASLCYSTTSLVQSDPGSAAYSEHWSNYRIEKESVPKNPEDGRKSLAFNEFVVDIFTDQLNFEDAFKSTVYQELSNAFLFKILFLNWLQLEGCSAEKEELSKKIFVQTIESGSPQECLDFLINIEKNFFNKKQILTKDSPTKEKTLSAMTSRTCEMLAKKEITRSFGPYLINNTTYLRQRLFNKLIWCYKEICPKEDVLSKALEIKNILKMGLDQPSIIELLDKVVKKALQNSFEFALSFLKEKNISASKIAASVGFDTFLHLKIKFTIDDSLEIFLNIPLSKNSFTNICQTNHNCNTVLCNKNFFADDNVIVFIDSSLKG